MVTVGSVAKVNLEIWQGQDLIFDIRWWGNTAKTEPVDISGFESAIKLRNATEDLLNLADYIEIDLQESHVLHVSVPAAITATLPVSNTNEVVWDLDMTASGSGEVKKIYGTVKIFKEVTSVAGP